MVDAERISLRLEQEDLVLLDDFVEQHPEFSNRSHLARLAIRAFIEKDGAAVSKSSGNRVTIKITGRARSVIEELVQQEYYDSVEDAIQKSIEFKFLEKDMADNVTEAHRTSKKSFDLK